MAVQNKNKKFTVMPLNKTKRKLRSDERVGKNGKVYRVKKESLAGKAMRYAFGRRDIKDRGNRNGKSKMVEGIKNLTEKQVEEGKLFFQNPDGGGVEFTINEFPIKEWKFKAEPQSSFDESVNNRLAKIKELLLIKGKEYIRNNDKYHNFKRTAEMNRTTETRALHGMNSKHIVSLLDMLDDIDAGKKIEVKFVEEKIGYLMVYLVILEALIKEKYSSPGF